MNTHTNSVSSLVLGGGGFIGANLSRQLAQRGQVRAFGRSFPAEVSTYLTGVQTFVGDLTATEQIAPLLEGVESVYHLVSASIPGSKLSAVEDVERNVVSTLRLLDECVRNEVKRVVFVSSGGTIYGDYPILSPSNPLDVGRGVYAPTTSVDEYFAELALWFGVTPSELDQVLPNVRSFYSPESNVAPIGFLGA